MSLDSGDYDIWYDGWSLYDVEITGPSGQDVDIKVKSSTESINSVVKYGTFSISSSGIYTRTYGGGANVYITDPISVASGLGLAFGGCGGGILLTLIGVGLTIAGAVMKSKSGSSYKGSGGGSPAYKQKKCPRCGTMVSSTETVCPECYSNL